MRRHIDCLPAAKVGPHWFEALGFDDCCDQHSELEVQLPPANTSVASNATVAAGEWVTVVAGPSPSLVGTCPLGPAVG